VTSAVEEVRAAVDDDGGTAVQKAVGEAMESHRRELEMQEELQRKQRRLEWLQTKFGWVKERVGHNWAAAVFGVWKSRIDRHKRLMGLMLKAATRWHNFALSSAFKTWASYTRACLFERHEKGYSGLRDQMGALETTVSEMTKKHAERSESTCVPSEGGVGPKRRGGGKPASERDPSSAAAAAGCTHDKEMRERLEAVEQAVAAETARATELIQEVFECVRPSHMAGISLLCSCQRCHRCRRHCHCWCQECLPTCLPVYLAICQLRPCHTNVTQRRCPVSSALWPPLHARAHVFRYQQRFEVDLAAERLQAQADQRATLTQLRRELSNSLEQCEVGDTLLSAPLNSAHFHPDPSRFTPSSVRVVASEQNQLAAHTIANHIASNCVQLVRSEWWNVIDGFMISYAGLGRRSGPRKSWLAALCAVIASRNKSRRSTIHRIESRLPRTQPRQRQRALLRWSASCSLCSARVRPLTGPVRNSLGC
jgi:hypothetical protein